MNGYEYVVKTPCYPAAYKVEPRTNATCNFFRTMKEALDEIAKSKKYKERVEEIKKGIK